ncbi:methylated-DNA--[protein]-cysteine S-methyltransferase [Pontiellaceae bacterium B12227]|nr:methylated-DNA--[protein]-cysteine S-methyltransferase [Pontiellaceae bacterium B12227]
MTDYERIARVIRYIEEHRETQPNLETLARIVGLSASHFHRLFSGWAGITPKDFLQCLTLSDARRRLQEGKSVLDAALDSGLSGPGRLHDLCVNLEAATPGEIKTGGKGWIIQAGIAESPFGNCLIAESPRGICHLSFFQPLEVSSHWKKLESRWPHAELVKDDMRAHELCSMIFKPDFRAQEPLKAYVKGTAFQVKVWRALLEIPEGKLLSYGQLAARVGNSKASRAVGTAVGQNPIGFLIPCHRVIRETGAVGGYAWGTERKRAILVWENETSG